MKHTMHKSLLLVLIGLLYLGITQWGCTQKVNYPVQNGTSQQDENNQNEATQIPQEPIIPESLPPSFVSEELQNKEEQEVAPFIETYSVDAHVSGTIVQVVTELTIRNPINAHSAAISNFRSPMVLCLMDMPSISTAWISTTKWSMQPSLTKTKHAMLTKQKSKKASIPACSKPYAAILLEPESIPSWGTATAKYA